MFLTGFDSKKLNTLYVDQKFEQPHSLVQALSRTNRVYAGTNADGKSKLKKHGNIIFFQNEQKMVQNALTRFSSNIKNIVIEDYYALKGKLKMDIQMLKKISPLPKNVKS